MGLPLFDNFIHEASDGIPSHLQRSLQEASSSGASLVVLPEMWNCPYSNDSFPSYAEDIDAGASPSAAALAEAARGHAVTLVGGSIPERSDGKLYNTCLVYSKEGKLLAKHRKVRFALLRVHPSPCLLLPLQFLTPSHAQLFRLRQSQSL